jgi:hypothetical protein
MVSPTSKPAAAAGEAGVLAEARGRLEAATNELKRCRLVANMQENRIGEIKAKIKVQPRKYTQTFVRRKIKWKETIYQYQPVN